MEFPPRPWVPTAGVAYGSGTNPSAFGGYGVASSYGHVSGGMAPPAMTPPPGPPLGDPHGYGYAPAPDRWPHRRHHKEPQAHLRDAVKNLAPSDAASIIRDNVDPAWFEEFMGAALGLTHPMASNESGQMLRRL